MRISYSIMSIYYLTMKKPLYHWFCSIFSPF